MKVRFNEVGDLEKEFNGKWVLQFCCKNGSPNVQRLKSERSENNGGVVAHCSIFCPFCNRAVQNLANQQGQIVGQREIVIISCQTVPTIIEYDDGGIMKINSGIHLA